MNFANMPRFKEPDTVKVELITEEFDGTPIYTDDYQEYLYYEPLHEFAAIDKKEGFIKHIIKNDKDYIVDLLSDILTDDENVMKSIDLIELKEVYA